MRARPLVLVATVAVVLAVAAGRADAVTLYGGGSEPRTTSEPVALFLLSVDRGRVTVAGFSGGPCTNGRAGFGRFVTKRARLRRGRFSALGSFSFAIPGGVAHGSYRVRGRVRASTGVATGRASVRLRLPNGSRPPIVCTGLNRAFRARNPAVGRSRRTRGSFFGVTSQALPIVIHPSGDASMLAPVEMWLTLSCTTLGAVQPIQRLTIPRIAPGAYAENAATTGSFTPALGSTTSIPVGTYAYSPYSFQARIAGGVATGTAVVSAQVGNAGKQLIDTCSAPPVTFVAVR